MRQLFMICFLMLLPIIGRAQSDVGNIEGHVIDHEGLPVAGARVYLSSTFKSSGRMPITDADQQGKFKWVGALVGETFVYAYSLKAGVPDTLWTFYSEAYGRRHFPKVSVQRGQTVQNVVIRLPPPASHLFISVVDANTNRLLDRAIVKVNHQGKPKTLFEPGSVGVGKFDVLVPPNLWINLAVSAEGYKTWYFTDGSPPNSDALKMELNTSRELIVRLQPGVDQDFKLEPIGSPKMEGEKPKLKKP